MRKKTLNHLYDLLYYAFFMIIPIVAFLIANIHHSDVTLLSFFNEFGINSSNVIFIAFQDFFGSTGFLPLIADNSTLFYMFTYMSVIVLMHLVFDLLVFIPKLAHHYLNIFTRGVENE